MKKIKKDDEVIVIAGRDKGKRGTVREILADSRVMVNGVNMVKKHQRGNPQTGVQGGIIEREAPIQRSNIALYNSGASKADRVGIRVGEDGKRVRFFKSTGELVDG